MANVRSGYVVLRPVTDNKSSGSSLLTRTLPWTKRPDRYD